MKGWETRSGGVREWEEGVGVRERWCERIGLSGGSLRVMVVREWDERGGSLGVVV